MRIGFHANASAFSRFIQRAEAALNPAESGPVQEGLLEASGVYHEAMVARFDSASGGDGTWAPLAASTVKQHAKDGDAPPHILLGRTGELATSLRRDGAGHVIETTDSGITEGSASPVARYHQDGTPTIPARPICVTPEPETLEAMKGPIADGVRRGLIQAAGT